MKKNKRIRIILKRMGKNIVVFVLILAWLLAGWPQIPYFRFPPRPASVKAAIETGYSFQRKTWYDGTRYWRAYNDTTDARIEFEYSTDGTSWTENSSARIAVSTTDFSLYGDASNAYIVYTNGYDIEARKASTYPGTGFSWGTATIVYDGSATTNYYRYPTLAYDSNSKVWVSAMNYETGSIVDKQIAAADDDGADTTRDSTFHTKGEPTAWNTNTLAVGGKDTTYIITTGFRFTGITIPQGATINTATLDIKEGWGGNYTSNVKTTITGGLTANLSTFSNSNLPRNVPKTTASVSYNSIDDGATGAGTWWSVNRPIGSIASIIQEIVNQSSWASNNALGLFITDNGSTDDWWFTGYAYENAAADSAKLNVTYTAHKIVARQASNANDITTWGTATTLDTSSNTNKYSVIVPRTSGSVFAVWMDGTAIESKNYNGTSWDSAPTSVDTGLTGTADTFSAVADSSGNVYLLFVDDETTDQISVRKWNGTSWGAATLVADAADANDSYPTISLDTTGSNLYAFWIDVSTNVIYYSSCALSTNCDAASEWAAETSWKTTGTNTFISSNYSGASLIFAQWHNGTTIAWDKLAISSNSAPSAPTGLYVNERATTAQSGVAAPVAVGDGTPVFSAVYNDSDVGDVANKYEVIVYSDSSCTTQVWDSGSSGTSMTNCTQGNRCGDITFGGTALPFDGRTYYWKIRYWDSAGAAGTFSACTSDTFTMLGPAGQLRHGNYFFNNRTERVYTW